MTIWHVEEFVCALYYKKRVWIPISKQGAFLNLSLVFNFLSTIFLYESLMIALVLDLLIVFFLVAGDVINQIHHKLQDIETVTVGRGVCKLWGFSFLFFSHEYIVDNQKGRFEFVPIVALSNNSNYIIEFI